MKKKATKIENKNVSLEITKNADDKLTKNQKLFNKLTKEIEELEKDIIAENTKAQKILEYYSKSYRPIAIELAELRIKLAMSIGKTKETLKYTKNQTEDIKESILCLCIDAFSDIEPNEEQESFYDKWSEQSYKEELKEQEEQTKESISNFMEAMFGIDIDPNDFGTDAKGFAEIQQKFQEEFAKKKEEEEIKQSKKKKTKNQIKLEENAKVEEEIKNKSIRGIYIMLAKILHPDSEIDPKLKLEKEEIMKKVTLAYDQKDLSSLLKLEMEWVHKETKHLEKLSDAKLKIYIAALNQQIAELNQEKMSILMNPRFQEISEYLNFAEKTAINKIRAEIKSENKLKDEFNDLINKFETTQSKKPIIDFVKNYLHEIRMINMSNSMFESFF